MRVFSTIAILVYASAALAQGHGGHGGMEIPRAPAPQPTKKEAEKKEEPRVPVEVEPEKQARMGLKIGKVGKEVVEHTIRTVGTVTADQTREAHVHTKIPGWVENIHADYVGKPIKKGQPLYDLYSPDLVSTQEEYLAARRQGGTAKEIATAALERLRLWGVPEREIDAMTRTGKAKRTVTFDSPVEGFILNKTAIRGMYITPEMELYHIADLSRVWVLLTLYENDVAIISKGDKVDIQLPYDPTKPLKGEISYIYPEIDTATRTAKARIEFDNKTQTLKPGMFANVEITKSLGESIVVPEDAVIDTGTRKIVFVKSGPAKFEPREVKLGPRVGNRFVIVQGLSPGEEIVTSAHFLIDAESKLQAALRTGAPGTAGHQGHGVPGEKK